MRVFRGQCTRSFTWDRFWERLRRRRPARAGLELLWKRLVLPALHGAGRALGKLAVAVLNLLPRRIALRLGEAAGSLLYAIAERTRFRGAVTRTIRTAFPDRFTDAEVDALARRHARDLLKTAVEVARFRELPALLARGDIRAGGLEHLEAALAEGRGAVLLSAHLGNWELLISALGLLGYPVHAVVLRQSSTLFNRWLVRERERFGSKVVYADEATREGVARILEGNGLLLLLADHHHYGGSARNIVDFFGRPVSVPGGPVAYSTRFRAPLIPIYTLREAGDRHRIVVEPPLQLIETGRPGEDFLANCRLYISVFERWITEHPDQWMWSHERWAWLDEHLRPRFES